MGCTNERNILGKMYFFFTFDVLFVMKEFSILILFFFALVSCNNEPKFFNFLQDSIVCSVEKKYNSRLLEADNGFYLFKGAKKISEAASFSGKNSLEIEPDKFGFEINFKDFDYLDKYKVSVWKKGGELSVVACGNKESEFYLSKSEVSKKEGDWELIEFDFHVPASNKIDYLSFYVWNIDNKSVFADDFKIIRTAEKYPEYPNSIELKLAPEAYRRLMLKREEAFKAGILESSDDDWVDAEFLYKDKLYKCELRLKGDWLDHLIGKKWSFRIKLKGNDLWNDMRVFSVHNPIARDFLSEWVAHCFFERIDLLTTKYGFVPVKLNGTSLGIYAFEEHFDKHLFESRERREGLILKLDESDFWKLQQHNLSEKEPLELPCFEASTIVPFRKEKVFADSALYSQFDRAQQLLFDYKFAKRKVSDVFDIDYLARFFAALNIMRTYHSLNWHNTRFYYNPITSKLEPIAYDCYTEYGMYNWLTKPIFGDYVNESDIHYSKYLYQIFHDEEFIKKYIHYNKSFSDPAMIKHFIDSLSCERVYYESLIREEFKDYKYDTSFIATNADEANYTLKAFTMKLEKNPYDKFLNIPYTYNYDTVYPLKFVPYFVQSFKNRNSIAVINYNYKMIEVIGYRLSSGKEQLFESVKIVLPYYKNNIEISELPKVDASHILFKYEGIDSIFYSGINEWRFDSRSSEVEHSKMDESFIQLADSIYSIKEGRYVIDHDIIIPKNHKLVVGPGVQLDIVKNAMFISFSPIEIIGTAEKPVLINSSDKSASGFTVINENQKSIIKYVTFDGLNTLNKYNRTLTGAVTFYKSNVTIENCSFVNNVCEDGLNLFKCNFSMNWVTFNNTFSDALDFDFCSGLLKNSTFLNSKADAVDLSGSRISMKNCVIKNSGDKGISCGEKSSLIVSNCDISDGVIGVASKDKSTCKVTDIRFSNLKYGFVLLVKKDEYGPAVLYADKVTFDTVETEYLIEKKSALYLNNEKIEGTESKLKKRFY
jgi:hypothetical protein